MILRHGLAQTRRWHVPSSWQIYVRRRYNSHSHQYHDIDPYDIVAPHLAHLNSTLLASLGSSHPTLTQVTEYYFQQRSKQIRPLLILLWSQATNGACIINGVQCSDKDTKACSRVSIEELDCPITQPDVLNDWNPNYPKHTRSFSTTLSPHSLDSQTTLREPSFSPSPFAVPVSDITSPGTTCTTRPQTQLNVLPTQIRLAQIVEMVHVASLLHDDVIDQSSLRRGVRSAPSLYGDKVSILAGNFLIGRAFTALARLEQWCDDCRKEGVVVMDIMGIIEDLVQGEIAQMRGLDVRGGTNTSTGNGHQVSSSNALRAWGAYLTKTYLKTASLMAKSLHAAVILGERHRGAQCPNEHCYDRSEIYEQAAYTYGGNFGIAFQLMDDILDYEAASETLGKLSGADLKLGLVTAPALYAWEEFEELGPLIMRKFKQEGDIETARELVGRSSGVERAKNLAREYAERAKDALGVLDDSNAKKALEVLADRLV